MKAVPLADLAEIVRSKNCSPFALTLDVIFPTDEIYRRAKENGVVDRALVRRIYGIDDERILDIVYFDAARAVKVTIARPAASGAVGDTDVYGAQQHVPLLTAEVPWEGSVPLQSPDGDQPRP
jgi:hypothetical protein